MICVWCSRPLHPDAVMGRAGITALSADLLRFMYAEGLEKRELTLKDRVAALGVCRAWREALSTAALPIPYLGFYEGNALTLCNWLMAAQPAVEEIFTHIYDLSEASLELLPLALHSLPHKALHTLTSTPSLFPNLGAWPSIRKLWLDDVPLDAAWLEQLGSLRQLRSLQLFFVAPQQGGQMLLFPAVASLTRLDVEVPAKVHLQLQLPRLPQLRELWTAGAGSVALEASTGAPASQLHSACLSAARVAVDFRQLPALSLLTLAPRRLEGAASVSGATSLSRLKLGIGYKPITLEHAWVNEVLHHAPKGSQCALGIKGVWSAEAAALVGDMMHLSGLFVLPSAPAFPLPPSNAPLWAQLRAFGWRGKTNTFLMPQALAAATRLEALQVYIKQPFLLDLELLASLPALRKLTLACVDESGQEAGDDLQSAALSLAGRAMPNLQVLAGRRAAESSTVDTFFDWAFGS